MEAVHIIHPENYASIAVAKRIGAIPRVSENAQKNLVYVTTREGWSPKDNGITKADVRRGPGTTEDAIVRPAQSGDEVGGAAEA
ncbi:hypothetical protein SAMN02927900_00861 [Rhizobium mongolense subsp. loessense]|uniref:Uncharacterized protein n=2 Tax=Rhizobium mongolense TaxID=57676 RepID=A0A1G4PR99_9HYPH|nr:hypothetical protein SAMN02927900_00861 [Rhizobium mongolense subsp. loessense]